MKLNILLITYNQEQYIEQALDSILMQKTTFEFNIVVADDCSTDRTFNILQNYAKDSSIEFVFLDNTANLGFVKNYQRAFNACSAPYIAIMEGDDYWISPRRLQQHVDFLDSHNEASMSFNRIIYYFQDKPDSFRVSPWNLDENFEKITTEQMIVGNKIGNLSACVFRKEVINRLKPEIFDLNFADWLLGMSCGQFGYIAQLKEPTSIYRVHPNGQWSRMTENEQIKEIIKLIPVYNNYLDYKYNEDFLRYENYLKKILTQKDKKYSFKDFIPPILGKLRR